jgi:hypothetical protein
MTATGHRSHVIRAIAVGSFATELLFSGCSKPVERSEELRPAAARPTVSTPASPFPTNALPAAYFAQLDTPGGRSELWTLWLKPDIYFLRVEYRERAGSSSEDVIGTWEPIVDRAAIRLRSTGRSPIELEVPNPDTLRFRGIVVRHPTDPPAYLVRNPAIQYLEPRVNLIGYLACVGDVGHFQDCGTAWRLPILMGGDFKSALRKYLDVRIVQRPDVDGGPPGEWLFIERFVRAMAGKSCDDSSAVAERERREQLTQMPYGLR